MSTSDILDPQKIAAASLTAYALGTLCAQTEFGSDYGCATAFYITDHPDYPHARCGIGAGMTAEQARRAENRPAGLDYKISRLILAGLFGTTSIEAMNDLQLLQQLHDVWSSQRISRTLKPRPGTVEETRFVEFASAMANNTVTDEMRERMRT